MTFAVCLPIILDQEGGFSNDPRDAGGPTNLGVTQATLSLYLGRPATIDDVKALTPETVAPLYEARYYNASGADACPPGVDLMVFDMAVNMGVSRAVRALQAATGMTTDGIAGPATRLAASKCGPLSVIPRIAQTRETLYRSYAGFGTFGAGWLARLARVTGLAMGMVH